MKGFPREGFFVSLKTLGWGGKSKCGIKLVLTGRN